MPVMILLTDGLPNQVPYAEDGSVETTVLRAAQAAKAAGITIYTIGVGRQAGPRPQVNPALLRAAASRPDMYYGAPDAAQLSRIYSELSRVIPCGGQQYWPAR
jgi:nitric oxide reductase activation protein